MRSVVSIEPLTYIRGRSLPQQYIIVDEAQNLTPHEVKTIITRSGDGTKIVLTGDPGQIDNPYVDSASNGLAVAADRFRGERVAAHIVLTRGERSELASLDARQAQIVELRYFGGLSIEDTAAVTRTSPATVKREWAAARAWLRRELEGR